MRQEAGSNQYGFYAVPKAVEPKKKYRQSFEDQYSEDQEEVEQTLVSIDQPYSEEIQPDYYVNRAPYPQFKPRERGLDYGVQIEHGDLFDYEMEVRPLIQILVGRSVVSAINQLQEEVQRSDQQATLHQYQIKRNAELMVTQRMEAKSKRKREEAQRRKLQKNVYVSNSKQGGAKLIARKKAKQCLLGLKGELYRQLEESGYLRSNAILDLRIQYENWIYQEVNKQQIQEQQGRMYAENIIREGQLEEMEQHRMSIEKEQKRRQQILNERQRIKKENQQIKRKKKIRKERMEIRNRRQQDYVRFEELMDKYEQVQSILQYPEISNGLTHSHMNSSCIYITGGLFNYVLVLLQSLSKQFNFQEMENYIFKLIRSCQKLEITLSEEQIQKVEKTCTEMENDGIQFMKNNRQQFITTLINEIALDLSFLQAMNFNINSNLHSKVIEILLNIILTTIPQPKKQGEEILDSYQPTEKDKLRAQIKNKIKLTTPKLEKQINQLEAVEKLFRVHFQTARKKQQKQQKEDQWIDIYDGQGWDRKKQQVDEEIRDNQSSTAYTMSGFQNSYVIDERVLYYLRIQLEKLFEIKAGDLLNSYGENLSNIRGKIAKDIPIFDIEVKQI